MAHELKFLARALLEASGSITWKWPEGGAQRCYMSPESIWWEPGRKALGSLIFYGTLYFLLAKYPGLASVEIMGLGHGACMISTDQVSLGMCERVQGVATLAGLDPLPITFAVSEVTAHWSARSVDRTEAALDALMLHPGAKAPKCKCSRSKEEFGASREDLAG